MEEFDYTIKYNRKTKTAAHALSRFPVATDTYPVKTCSVPNNPGDTCEIIERFLNNPSEISKITPDEIEEILSSWKDQINSSKIETVSSIQMKPTKIIGENSNVETVDRQSKISSV